MLIEGVREDLRVSSILAYEIIGYRGLGITIAGSWVFEQLVRVGYLG